MVDTKQSEKIKYVKWGQLCFENDTKIYKDLKCYPGGFRIWDWNETGTRHQPGIQITDVEELLQNGSEVVVLSKGVESRLETKKETLDYLERNKVQVHHLQTEEAIAMYNDLVSQGAKVGGLFHSTC